MSVPILDAVGVGLIIASFLSLIVGGVAHSKGSKSASAKAKAEIDEARSKAKEDIRRALGPQTKMELLAVRLHNADAGKYGTKADHFGELGIRLGPHWLEKAKQCAAICECGDAHESEGGAA